MYQYILPLARPREIHKKWGKEQKQKHFRQLEVCSSNSSYEKNKQVQNAVLSRLLFASGGTAETGRERLQICNMGS